MNVFRKYFKCMYLGGRRVLHKTIMLVMKILLCMHSDMCHFDAQNVLMQMQHI